ncbi:hypothetical protein KL921_002743 [Ogataea angusta]|uniref:Uncharacterized protein n=1 Tax=Pichia angusta TaxID=870730 RepID=A0ABQ7RYR6_PICAN|nr:hypothetical protein KL921_002743 [Ogataea angusta]KAG7840760.1 hypothetical protein KL942_001748 [Ogataea angusta]KAG7850089.1 hypothetical protein KL940_002457 [Ogataea angusta]
MEKHNLGMWCTTCTDTLAPVYLRSSALEPQLPEFVRLVDRVGERASFVAVRSQEPQRVDHVLEQNGLSGQNRLAQPVVGRVDDVDVEVVVRRLVVHEDAQLVARNAVAARDLRSQRVQDALQVRDVRLVEVSDRRDVVAVDDAAEIQRLERGAVPFHVWNEHEVVVFDDDTVGLGSLVQNVADPFDSVSTHGFYVRHHDAAVQLGGFADNVQDRLLELSDVGVCGRVDEVELGCRVAVRRLLQGGHGPVVDVIGRYFANFLDGQVWQSGGVEVRLFELQNGLLAVYGAQERDSLQLGVGTEQPLKLERRH